MSSTPDNVTMAAIDGRDALAYVIIRPGSNDSGVVIEAAANGISKAHAAYALRHTAQSWDPDDSVGADVGQQLKAAHAEIKKLRAKLESATDRQADILIDCATCNQPAHWIDCPTGGWWAHEVHPADEHDAAAVEIDLINEIQLLRAEQAEPTRPSPAHSAIYMDGDRQVWSDYPTLPPGDDVLPMVWASQQAQSKADLAERGVELRVIGWIK